MKRSKILAIILTLCLLCSLFTAAQTAAAAPAEEQSFAEAFASSSETRPSTRYWLPTADMDHDAVADDLAMMKEAGYGCVEIIHIAESSVSVEAEDAWGTEKWNQLMDFIITTCEGLDLEVDMTVGPTWPAAVNEVTFESASKKLTYETTALTAENTADGTVVLPSHNGNEYRLQAVVLAKTSGDVRQETETYTGGWTASLQTIRCNYTILDEASLTDLTPYLENGSVDEEAGSVKLPDGVDLAALGENESYLLFTFYSELTGQSVSSGGGTKKQVVDHYSYEGTQAIIDMWEDGLLTDTMKAYLEEHGTSDLFEDSLELSSGTLLPWTTEALAEFEDAYQYDLVKYLPLLINRPHNFLSANGSRYGLAEARDDGIYADYQNLFNDLYLEKHVRVIADWAQGHHLTYRVQAYSGHDSGFYDSCEAAAIPNLIIEGESLAFQERPNGGYDSWRVLSGGAHVAGNQIISDEMGAFSQLGYRVTFASFVESMNQNIAGGANRMVIHGFPADVEGYTSWPGWHPFGTGAAEPWEENQPVWEDFSLLTDYIARTQFVMQSGKAKIDVAVYDNRFYIKEDKFENDALTDYGFSYEFLSANTMQHENAVVTDGILCADSAAYKAFVVENETFLPLAAAERLTEYAKAGLPVFFVGTLPTRAANGDAAGTGKDAEVKAAIEALVAEYDNVYFVESADELAPAMKAAGITPDADYAETSDLMTLHRVDGETDYYWIYNSGSEDISHDITFEGSGYVFQLNAWNGEVSSPASIIRDNGSVTMNVSLKAGETTMLAITPEKLDDCGDVTVISDAETYYNADGSMMSRYYESGIYEETLSTGETVISGVTVADTVDLTGAQWTMQIEKWSEGATANSTEKTQLTPYEGSLKMWGEIEGVDGLDETTVGRAVYTTTVTLPEDWDVSQGAVLQLATAGGLETTITQTPWGQQTSVSQTNGTAAITGVTVNGEKAAALDQTTKSVDVGSLLKAGENTIEVSVATTLANAKGFKMKYGLVSAQLIPYTDVMVYEADGAVEAAAVDENGGEISSVRVGSDFLIRVTTAASVTDVRLYNEYDMQMGRKSVSVEENGQGGKTWTIGLSLGTVGQGRSIKIITKGQLGYYKDSGVRVTVDVASVPAAISSFTLPETAVANRTFVFTAVTDLNAAKLVVCNEYGTTMGLRSVSYKDVDGQRVWTGVMSIGTSGARTLTAYAKNTYGVLSESGAAAGIEVAPFVAS